MRTVRDAAGRTYLLVERSGESSKVRDPETGEVSYLDSADLELVRDESPLATAARAVPEPLRRVLTAVPDERALGLLVELRERGPLSARRLLDDTALCESDLHGLLGELRAAGLVEERRVAGERGYAATDATADALAAMTGDDSR